MCIPGLLQRRALRSRPDLSSPIIGSGRARGAQHFSGRRGTDHDGERECVFSSGLPSALPRLRPI